MFKQTKIFFVFFLCVVAILNFEAPDEGFPWDWLVLE